MYNSEKEFELSILYFGAVSACCNATCTLEEDDEESLLYVRNRLYSALYDMTEFLIRRARRVPPASLEHRIYRVPELYGERYRVPYICRRLLDRKGYLYKNELDEIAQAMDLWFISRCKEFVSECLPGSVLHSYVG